MGERHTIIGTCKTKGGCSEQGGEGWVVGWGDGMGARREGRTT